jgi:dolichyl-phosphate-mannose-protein mannosyltransferase
MLHPGESAQESGAPSQKKTARKLIYLIQGLFLAVALFQMDGPFLSAHNERQNQTFDMARNVFHHGWHGLLAPQASFSVPGYEQQPFISLQLEFPFHGLFGWPISKITSHERAIVRIISVFFALASIHLIYVILGHWFKPGFAVAGAAIWAASPLLLQFGRAPMPDILCTTGMLAAFWFALRGNLPASSTSFLFSILAKTNVIVFGLPILVALLIKRNKRSFRSLALDCCLWGLVPLFGLITWVLLMHWFSPPTPLALRYWVSSGNLMAALKDINLWIQIAACLIPFGVGVLGFLCLAASCRPISRIHPALKVAIVVSNVAYLILVLSKVHEPQYFLPVLPWIIVAATAGLEFLASKLPSGLVWRAGLATLVGLHVVVAAALAVDLRSSRVPDFPSIERMARLLPSEARVIVAYRFYGASPAVWLNRNVFAVGDIGTLTLELPKLRSAGFTHLCILDIENRHNLNAGGLAMLWKQLQTMLGHSPASSLHHPDYTAPTSSIRQYCDRRFPLLFDSPHALLYSLTSIATSRPEGQGLRQGKSHPTGLGHSAGSRSGLRLFSAHALPGTTAIRGGRYGSLGPARRLSPMPLEDLGGTHGTDPSPQSQGPLESRNCVVPGRE